MSTTVWIYVDASKQVGNKDHLKVFASEDAAGRPLPPRRLRSPTGCASIIMEYVANIDEAGDEGFGKLASGTRPFCPRETWLSLPKPKRGCRSQAINTPHFSLLSVSSSSQGKPKPL
jgi:hypothetical protein